MRTADITAGDWYQLKADNAYGMGPVYLEVTEIRYRPRYKTPWLTCRRPLTHEPVGSFRPSDFARNYNDDTLHYNRGIGSGATHVRVKP